MPFSLRESNYPEYRALRAKSQGWALIWSLGHGFFWMCFLAAPGVIAAWWVLRNDPEPHHNVYSSVIAPVLVFAVAGVALKRYAIKKGMASDGAKG